MSSYFDDQLIELVKNDAIKKFRYYTKKIPYGYIKGTDGAIKTKTRTVLEAQLDFSKLDFLYNLSDKYVIQIGDTFYRKGGACFIYDYLHGSNDYNQNLHNIAINNISIFLDGDLPNESC